MCRFTLYLGPPIRLEALVTQPKNSLIHQSFHNHERREPLNGDGFGVAWYDHDRCREPALFRSITPAWNNANLHSLAHVVESSCILAHVRAATRSYSVSQFNCHPFTWGPYSFMHNGIVGGFPAVRRPLLERLSDPFFDAIQGTTDSEHVFALFLENLARGPANPAAEDLADALRRTIEEIHALVERHAPQAYSLLNLAVSDGRCAVVTRCSTKPDYPGESLHVDRGRRYLCEEGACRMVPGDETGGAVIVSSEALSRDPGWETVPPDHFVLIRSGGQAEQKPL